MAQKKMGLQTVKFVNPPSIISSGTIVGPKEGQGPLKDYFDMILTDDTYGEKSWEKAECKMFQDSVNLALKKASLNINDIDYLIGGDLLNQIITSSFAARQFNVPTFGLYGACSTMAEGLSIGSMLIDGGFADYVIVTTSSHFSTAERQYRFPLEQGVQRPFTAQWTVTGSGSSLLSSTGSGPYITHVTTGKVVDLGMKDANNMGAAMAPAAADTIITHFNDTGFTINDYDLIITGDMARVGKSILMELLNKDGLNIEDKYKDCGIEIYDESQDVHSGGSGAGCSAVVLNGWLLSQIKNGTFNRVLFIATGALLSPTSTQQGESIPGIAHAVTISRYT
ncbi:stage V sporulation protein AD [Thermoanaerobacterium thermosaccharolyticum]|jgi:stage V sporulation protein AD|uniref:Stage V sporulation protein AD n=1 Tax=Thermoanaerobacterium thermosaccharolyticum (strain ATCC 7956 / DSM 571 / NCIMB 9385 / NCA 3814 / NCTC 13789 / WDCM 00135 / 2032) TaxID=580327 RepID=D9TQV8_THETC|nr:stage V sporulation protein AD [Thermoanaerobacterium thermosaccharolyticum]ADL68851.1 stage V sporulation protein AD [Thermoanaerobacterium thermosaccharolyticum DSM 571]KAA5807661.1 stage V sporulation protein AD [Thermoanaerobacterium thermosaccharolyticum]TCW37227.1 stage V sporulation protein AD [Thermohydrogenium kirishiense]